MIPAGNSDLQKVMNSTENDKCEKYIKDIYILITLKLHNSLQEKL